ncbi:hypothetical protein [Microtetraspora malaysiensis]|uniref:Uncharacterized protein n=1 Tax=Microtetraspora malaysiensis TaxID=161358 RepID=A0ABW6SKW0_9ACTN
MREHICLIARTVPAECGGVRRVRRPLLSELAVADELADGRLLAASPEGVDLQRGLRAVWIEGGRLDGPARSLLTLATRSISASRSAAPRSGGRPKGERSP